jgi:hypothetical protein
MKEYTTNLIVKRSNNALATTFESLETAEVVQSEPTPAALWDAAYNLKKKSGPGTFVEPNNIVPYTFDNPAFKEGLESTVGVCERDNDFDNDWPKPDHKSIWHLDDGYSELKKARNSIGATANKVRIAHFDTGYDSSHQSYPASLINHDLERNFVEPQTPRRAEDNYSTGALRQPGHGTGTLSILAGKLMNIPDYGFNDTIGLASGIEIVPIRIAKSVILFKNEAFSKALEYVISLYDDPATRIHVITMSMGGLPSRDWADLVNTAYEKGIFIVTAAGNNFGRTTPTTLVYPARFKRVVAACGVTFDYSPYYKPLGVPFRGMQGNFGPRKAMGTSIAAFTPNMPWAKIGCGAVVSLSGAGTSSATPQVASAAALYRLKYFQEIENLAEGWMKVEAIRYALFSSASQQIKNGFEVAEFFGRGVLKASAMLAIQPDQSKLKKEEPDKVSWPLLKLLTGINTREMMLEQIADPELREMMELEISQLVARSARLQEILHGENKSIDELTIDEQRQFVNEVLRMDEASKTLKDVFRKL